MDQSVNRNALKWLTYSGYSIYICNLFCGAECFFSFVPFCFSSSHSLDRAPIMYHHSSVQSNGYSPGNLFMVYLADIVVWLVLGLFVSNEVQRMWKETFMACFNVLHWNLCWGAEKTGKPLRIASCRFYTHRVVRSGLCHRYSMIVLLHSTAFPLEGNG
jgi:hypothetical protein